MQKYNQLIICYRLRCSPSLAQCYASKWIYNTLNVFFFLNPSVGRRRTLRGPRHLRNQPKTLLSKSVYSFIINIYLDSYFPRTYLKLLLVFIWRTCTPLMMKVNELRLRCSSVKKEKPSETSNLKVKKNLFSWSQTKSLRTVEPLQLYSPETITQRVCSSS